MSITRSINKPVALLALLVVLAGIVFPLSSVPAQQAEAWQSKVDPWVIATASQGQTEFLVFLAEQADLSAAAALPTKSDKGAYVFRRLTETAARTQPAVIAALQALGVEYRPYWVANLIWVRGDLDAIQALAGRGDVAHLYANPMVRLQEPVVAPQNGASQSPSAIEWNIAYVNADDVWAAGFTGQGAVIAGQDTGYDWDHPALKNQYRGWNGAAANHNYNWHDAIHSGGGVCGPNSPNPCDDNGHGTHTMGTMVGDDSGSNQIGMAPGARWIGCRNMDQGNGTPGTYTECYQWFIAPTDLNNQNPRPDLAPDVINNSWGCPPSEGCTDPNVMLTVVNNVRAAGILTAHSAGNAGSSCSTVNEPAAIYDASFTVGATGYLSDNIASFSSRGPVTVDGSGRRKPDISAPGVNIRSSVPGGGYAGGWQGTSMAAPHVAGLVGLLVSASPGLSGQVDTLEDIIEQSAVPRTTSQNCGSIPGSQVPNNTYGWGRIDAWAAYLRIPAAHSFDLSKLVSSAVVVPGEVFTYTLSITHLHNSLPTANVVLTDTLPAGATFVSATQPYTIDGATVRWSYASLGPGEKRTVRLAVQADPLARGVVINQDYGVRSDDVATLIGNPVQIDVVPLDLLLKKSAPALVAPGGVLTYTLTVTNPHPSATVHNLVLTDTLPADTTFITATLPHTLTGSTAWWDFAALGPSQAQSVELVVQASPSAAGAITNQDYALTAVEANRLAGLPVNTLVVPYDLQIAKTAPALASPGGLLTYTLTVTNTNDLAPAHNLVLTDSLPAHTAFIAATQPVTLANDLLTWTRPSLGPGQSWTVELSVRVPVTYTGAIINQDYGVRSAEVGPRLGPPVHTEIHALALAKSASSPLVARGDLLTYTLAVTNQHPLAAVHSLVLSDTLPAHTAFVSATSPYTLTGDVVTWQAPALASGASWVVTLTVRVDSSELGSLTNADYRVVSAETPTPLYGAPLETRLVRLFFMPFVHAGFSP